MCGLAPKYSNVSAATLLPKPTAICSAVLPNLSLKFTMPVLLVNYFEQGTSSVGSLSEKRVSIKFILAFISISNSEGSEVSAEPVEAAAISDFGFAFALRNTDSMSFALSCRVA